MNFIKKNAIVKWEGEKKNHLPMGLKYITVAKFSGDENWINEAWSIVLEFLVPPSEQGNPSKATVRFLMANAPQEKLITGSKFKLYEGKELTASVTIE